MYGTRSLTGCTKPLTKRITWIASYLSTLESQKMNRIPTKARRALFDIMGAIVIIGVGVILMLAYFDVLTK